LSRHPPLLLCFLFGGFLQVGCRAKEWNCPWPFPSPFLSLGHIPIDMPTKRKVGIGCFPFSYLFLVFQAFVLTKETIDRTVGIGSSLFVFLVSSAHARGGAANDRQGIFLVWENWLPSKGTEPSGPILASPFFRLCRIPIKLPTEDEMLALAALPFCIFVGFCSIGLVDRSTLALFFGILRSCNNTKCWRRRCKPSSRLPLCFFVFGGGFGKLVVE